MTRWARILQHAAVFTGLFLFLYALALVGYIETMP